MKQTTKAYLILHFCVLLWGFTAILGKLISLDAVQLVWYRMMFVSLLFLCYPPLYKRLRSIPKSIYIQLIIVGFFLSLHWICFYGAIKLSNVSIALSMLATTSLITSFLEPILTGSRLKWLDVIIACCVFPGILLIFWDTDQAQSRGIIVGLLSALFAAIFTTLNKKNIHRINPTTATFVEIGSGFVFISIALPLYLFCSHVELEMVGQSDFLYLLLLAGVLTLLPFVLNLIVLRHLSAFSANLVINLEPVYGIILAILFFRENTEMTWTFYLGFFLVVASVGLYPILNRKITAV